MSTMQWGKPSSFAAVYEELNVPGFFVRFSDALLDLAALTETDRMLDVATGTGIVIRRARERTSLARTTGLDLNAGMLAVAREKSPTDAEFVEGDAQAMPFEDGSFDVLTCQQGVQFFPDRSRGLAEFHRVLAPGGRALVACWAGIDTAPGYAEIAAAMLDHLPDLAGAARNPFALSDADELAGLLTGAGFEDVSVQRLELDQRFSSASDLARAYVDGSALAISLADHPPETRETLTEDIVGRIERIAGDGAIALPLVTNIATGRRS